MSLSPTSDSDSDSNPISGATPARELADRWQAGTRPRVEDVLAQVPAHTLGQLAAALRVDQRHRWLVGERVPVEAYFERFPQLLDSNEYALDLIYAEFLVREQLGLGPEPADYESRFPGWVAELQQQVALHRAMTAEHGLLPATAEVDATLAGNEFGADDAEAWPRIPDYEIRSELGRGAVGVVYQAYHLPLKRVVAVKLLRDGKHASPRRLRRFLAEAEAAARLVHPNIVQSHGVGEHDGQLYLALEYVAGGSLLQARDYRAPPRAAALLIQTLARGVQYAHAQGILHRDLTPGNILLHPISPTVVDAGNMLTISELLDPARFTPKISDFGLAKLLQIDNDDPRLSDTLATADGDVLGTPSYMAPEQAFGKQDQVGPPADIYALGALLYELLTGQPTFHGHSPLDILEQLRRTEPVAPSRLVPKLSRDLETICLKCLAKQPLQRYASAGELADDLGRFLEGRAIRARHTGPAERLLRWCDRNRLVAALSVVVLVFGVVLAVALPLLRTIRVERDRAREAEHVAAEHLQRARVAERNLRIRAHLTQARSWLESKQVGQQVQCLEQVAAALRLEPPTDLRNQLRDTAIAALTRFDIRPEDRRPLAVFPFKGGQCDAQLRRYAVVDWFGSGDVLVPPFMPGDVFRIPHPGGQYWHGATKFSPSGRYLAVCYSLRSDEPAVLQVWDVSDRRRVVELRLLSGNVVAPVAFHPDGRRLVYVDPERMLASCDLADGSTHALFRVDVRPYDILIDRTGKRVVVNDAGAPRVRVFSFDGGQELASWTTRVGRYATALSLDGRLLVSADDATARTFVWYLPRNELLTVLDTADHLPISAQFSRRDSVLATTSWDDTTHFWEPVTGELLLRVRGSFWRFLDDGRAVVRHGNQLAAYNVLPGDVLRTLHWGPVGNRNDPPSHRRPVAVDFSPDGRWLATAGSDGAEVWDLATGVSIKQLDSAPCLAARFHPSFVDVGGTAFFVADDGVNGAELWKSDGTAGGTVLVKDIRPGPLGAGIEYMSNVNGTLFFNASDAAGNDELWKSDGTAAGTVQVKDINPTLGSSPSDFVDFNGTLFFQASDGVNGVELWKSDGTAAGTVLVQDINPTGSSVPFAFTVFNGELFFGATDGVAGRELWKTDGTALGTVLVSDINPGAGQSQPTSFAESNGSLFFSADDGSSGRELWTTDGTAVGTVQVADIRPGSQGSFPRHLTDVNGTLFLQATDAATGRELWKSDGTAVGTVLVEDIRPGAASSEPSVLTNLNGKLVFAANDGTTGFELWESDGTVAGTALIKDLGAGSGFSSGYLVNVGGELFFQGDDGVTGQELWKTDGTNAGTVQVQDTSPGSFSSSPYELANVSGTLFFRADASATGKEVWTSDGTAPGTQLVKDINVNTNDSDPKNAVEVNGTTFFVADDGLTRVELWKTDGTAGGTVQVKDIHPGPLGSSVHSLTNFNGTLFFSAFDPTNGRALWKSDGTAAGTVIVSDIHPAITTGSVQDFVVVGTTMFFSADDGTTGEELWKTDGTAAGTVLVKDINPGGANSAYNRGVNVNGTLFFTAREATSGYELWKSDGTAAGTVLVKDIRPGGASSRPSYLTEFNGNVAFTADDGTNGYELWQSDGTAAGTVMVKDIRPGPQGSYPNSLTSFNGELFFSADDGSSGDELWKTDGTTPGTVQVKDINPGPAGSSVGATAVAGSTLFLEACDGTAGCELWSTDGTTVGTTLVKDIRPRPAGSFPEALTNVSGTLLFAAGDGSSGTELWKSDGTGTGTVQVGDLEPGAAASSPEELVNAAGTLLFSAETSANGRELWILAPTANDDGGVGFTTDESTSLATASVLANDTHDVAGATLSVFAIDTGSTFGLVTDNGDGTLTYDPNGQFDALETGQSATDSFTYTVTDGGFGFDSATVTITINGVSDQTPVEEIEDVVDDIQDIIDSTPGNQKKLDDAIKKLNDAIDELNETPPDNDKAVGKIKDAVKKIQDAVDKGEVDPVVADQLMDTLTGVARGIAVDAIDLAITLGGDPGDIAKAQTHLADGDTARAVPDYETAVKEFKDAVKDAEKALPLVAEAAAWHGNPPGLSHDTLEAVVQQAIGLWSAAGVDAGRLAALRSLDVHIRELPEQYLGFGSPDAIWIDADAAGHGWHSDLSHPASERMDLLSVVSHELGHALGLHHDGHDGVMGSTISLGTRLLPNSSDAATHGLDLPEVLRSAWSGNELFRDETKPLESEFEPSQPRVFNDWNALAASSDGRDTRRLPEALLASSVSVSDRDLFFAEVDDESDRERDEFDFQFDATL